MDVIRVLAIHTFPVHGEAGVDHASVQVDEAGLVGDRPKKAAVSLVGADSPPTRANLVLDAPTERVEALDGVGGAHRRGAARRAAHRHLLPRPLRRRRRAGQHPGR